MIAPAYCPNCGKEFAVPVEIHSAERETSVSTGTPVLEVEFKTVRVQHTCRADT